MADATCSIRNCDRPVHSRSWCMTHYRRWRDHGDPQPDTPIKPCDRSDATLVERLMARTSIDANGCWTWTGVVLPTGYGSFTYGKRRRSAHRWMWIATEHDTPADLELDHLCRNRLCINPEHLELVTRRENLVRSPLTFAGRNAAKTHCLRGHPFDEANTLVDKRGHRICRTCKRDRKREAA